ncbi:hypothetical protein LguiA_013510 [Lonicera macranthoides]
MATCIHADTSQIDDHVRNFLAYPLARITPKPSTNTPIEENISRGRDEDDLWLTMKEERKEEFCDHSIRGDLRSSIAFKLCFYKNTFSFCE